MEPWLPSYRDGVLTLPSIHGCADLKLSRAAANYDDCVAIDVRLEQPHFGDNDDCAVSVTCEVVHRRRSQSIADLWRHAIALGVERGTTPVVSTEGASTGVAPSHDGALSCWIEHDGLGHYALWVRLRQRLNECDLPLHAGASFEVTLPVIVERASLEPVSEWWKHLIAGTFHSP